MINEEKQIDLNTELENNDFATPEFEAGDIEIKADNSQQLNFSGFDVSVSIRCEIGVVNLSLHDLHNLKIGDTVDFMRWPGFVRLSANNVTFAEGVLVEVNGMLGVKITKALQKIDLEV